MNWCLVFKGRYTGGLSGSEIRYYELAKALVEKGDTVSLVGLQAPSEPLSDIGFVPVKRVWSVLKNFISSDVVVLHGGGPLILLMASLAAWFNTRIILDAYAPHWLELFAAQQAGRLPGSLRNILKTHYNLFRTVFAGLCFDGILAANDRQKDLYRGIVAGVADFNSLERIHILPFGVQQYEMPVDRQLLVAHSRGQVCSEDKVVGWLGGVWQWFDLAPVLQAYAHASNHAADLKFVFFGIRPERFKEMQSQYEAFGGKPGLLLNLDYVDFDRRFDIWSSVDMSLVWGEAGLENDYASRTRNFDCISMGVPIIQNWDDQWGEIIAKHDAGLIVTEETISQAIIELATNPARRDEMSANIKALQASYSWQVFAEKLHATCTQPKRTTLSRLLGYPLALLAGLLIALKMLDTVNLLFRKNHA